MRKASLKSYVKNNFDLYLKTYKNSSKRYYWLLKKSKQDQRLAELAQAYFLLNDDFEKSKSFVKYTKENFESKDEFKKSNSKYPTQYRMFWASEDQTKNYFRKKLLYLFKKNKITLYKVSKTLNTHQSNVSLFFNKKYNKKLSLEKLEKLMRVYNRYDLLKNDFKN